MWELVVIFLINDSGEGKTSLTSLQMTLSCGPPPNVDSSLTPVFHHPHSVQSKPCWLHPQTQPESNHFPSPLRSLQSQPPPGSLGCCKGLLTGFAAPTLVPVVCSPPTNQIPTLLYSKPSSGFHHIKAKARVLSTWPLLPPGLP